MIVAEMIERLQSASGSPFALVDGAAGLASSLDNLATYVESSRA